MIRVPGSLQSQTWPRIPCIVRNENMEINVLGSARAEFDDDSKIATCI
jgi:hypothetical protein